MARLTLDEYKDIRAQVDRLEREVTMSLADEQLSGLVVLEGDAHIVELRRLLRENRPIMRRKKAKKASDVEAPKLIYSDVQECWVVA